MDIWKRLDLIILVSPSSVLCVIWTLKKKFVSSLEKRGRYPSKKQSRRRVLKQKAILSYSRKILEIKEDEHMRKSLNYSKRPGEIAQGKMFNPNFKWNKTCYMNFNLIIEVIKAYNSHFLSKVHVVWLFFYKFWLNNLIWEISPSLLGNP